ncbi:MAG: nucleotidyltransferase domain-containing protein [bacterium]
MKTIAELRDAKLRETLEVMKAEVKRIAGDGARLIVYGSHARGEEREDSDVDLMVVIPDEEDHLEMKDRIRFAVYKHSLKTEFLFSALIVPESMTRKMKGFKVFGEVEKEGMLI